MKTRNLRLVFWKDWVEIRRNWQILLPILIVPLMIAVILPVVFMVAPQRVNMPGGSLAQVEALIRFLPESVQKIIAPMTDYQKILYVVFKIQLIPLFLIIPILVSSVLSSDSFAGEKERKTMEGLLTTPLTDTELFAGKMLVAFVPSVAITVISYALFSALTYAMSLQVMGGVLLLPDATWLLSVLLLSPAVSLTSIGLTVAVSSRVKGTREAQQISVLLILPVLGLMLGAVSGVLILDPIVILGLTALMLLLDVVVLGFGAGTFNREKLLSQS